MVTLDRREERLRLLLATVRMSTTSSSSTRRRRSGLLTLNALVSADAVLIPLHCEYYALEGIADLWVRAPRAQRSIRNSTSKACCSRCSTSALISVSRSPLKCAPSSRRRCSARPFPRNVRLGEAPSHGMPVIQLRPEVARLGSRGARPRSFERDALSATTSAPVPEHTN